MSFDTHPLKSPEELAAFAAEFAWCWCCGHDGKEFGRELHVHHICKPGRSDERCNLARLCAQCHLLAEGHPFRINGKHLPVLTLARILWLKSRHDHENYERKRLKTLYRKALPIVSVPPPVFEAMYLMNRGERWPAIV